MRKAIARADEAPLRGSAKGIAVVSTTAASEGERIAPADDAQTG